MNVELAEAAGEVPLRCGVERLVLEEEHMAFGDGGAQVRNRAVGKRTRQIEPGDDFADGGRQRRDGEIGELRHCVGLSISARPPLSFDRQRTALDRSLNKVYLSNINAGSTCAISPESMTSVVRRAPRKQISAHISMQRCIG